MHFLSQINPRRFRSATTVWALRGGNEDNDLWSLRHTVFDQVLGEAPAITSVFVLTDEQRKQIACGVNIALTILGTEQPPIMLRLTDEHIGK